MPKGIKKSDWNLVHDLACEIVNASAMDDELLVELQNQKLLSLLHSLEKKYGPHPSILATIADFLDDPNERRAQYRKALSYAIAQNNRDEILEIEDSLKELDEKESS